MSHDLKLCSWCGHDKARSEFNRDRGKRDGLQSVCRRCQLDRNRSSIERNPAARRATLKRQGAGPRRETRDVDLAKRRAHRAVERAVARGDLTRPTDCPRCGSSDSPVHAHHQDYERPLDVTWLCARCHGRLHAEETKRRSLDVVAEGGSVAA